MGMNTRLDALLNVYRPKPFVFDVEPSKSKAATFTDMRIECVGADLIRISTDGDLTDISYKIIQLDGAITQAIEAAETPQFPGPVMGILLTNDTIEPGKTIRVARVHGNVGALSALPHGTPSAVSVASATRMFYAEKVEYAASGSNFFEADQPQGTTPSLFMLGGPLARNIRINTIKYQFTPTNAVTYQLKLLEAASADDQQSESDIIFDSGIGIVSGDIKIQVQGGSPAKLPIDVKLSTAGTIYYMVDWSAAPGDTHGYIKVYGEVLG